MQLTQGKARSSHLPPPPQTHGSPTPAPTRRLVGEELRLRCVAGLDLAQLVVLIVRGRGGSGAAAGGPAAGDAWGHGRMGAGRGGGVPGVELCTET